MSDTEPIARIELTSFTTAIELEKMINNLNYVVDFEVERVPNPSEEDPDFYLLGKRGDDDE